MKKHNGTILLATLTALTIFFTILSMLSFDPRKVFTYLIMGLAFSLVSIVVYFRKLEFLASSATHTSLLAVIIGLMIESLTRIHYFLWSMIIGLAIIHIAGFMIRKGIEPNNTSAIIVASTSAFSVIAAYILVTRFPIGYNLNSLFLGDPLLITYTDMSFVAGVTIIISVIFALSLFEILSLGIDEVTLKILGLKTTLYDLMTYTIIGLATIGLLRVSGYILQHVLILLPAITSSFYSRSGKELILLSITLSLFASSVGFFISLLVNLSPTGVTGVVLVTCLIHGVLKRWEK
ncbi:MAG: metal ABC transporter permease [Thermosphaera sp.]